jgi:hypothetical protein
MEERELQDNQVLLKTGQVVTVHEAKGSDAEEAQELQAKMNEQGNKAKMFSILMHMTCEVDGEKQPIEFYRNLGLGDFFAIQAKIADKNF